MTYEEAIKIVKNNIHNDYTWVIVETLEKQIPKKPKLLKNELLLVAGWQYGCPNCGCACGENKYHEEVTDAEHYCTQCGQALDWGDEL